MAIYRCEVKVIQRSKGRSATAAAAYRSASLIVDERTGEIHDYRRKAGVVECGIVMPEGSGWSPSRSTLWNAAEAGEKRKDGTPAREHIVALPHELSDGQRTRLVQRYSQDLANRHGCAVDYAIHLPSDQGDDRNHHAHILRTTRQVEGEDLGAKCAIEQAGRNRREDLVRERIIWEQHCNRALAEAGCEERVDHRSHADRGTGQEPQPKLGPAATAMKRRNERSDRAEEVDDVVLRNRRRDELNQAITEAEREASQVHDALEKERRGRAQGIQPLGADSGGFLEHAKPVSPPLGDHPANGASDPMQDMQRGGNRGVGQRQRSDLLPSDDVGHADSTPRPMQPSVRPVVTAAPAIPGIGGGGTKKKPKQNPDEKKRAERKRQEVEQQVESQFKKFTDALRNFGGRLVKGLRQQVPPSTSPVKQQTARAQPAPPPAPAQAVVRAPAQQTKASLPAAPADGRLEQYAAKILELDARAVARESGFKNPTGLHKLARAAWQEPNAQQNAQLQRRLGERALEVARKIQAGDSSALADLCAAANRLQQRDVLQLAAAERQHDARSQIAGLELSADRLASAGAGDLEKLRQVLDQLEPSGATLAKRAQEIGNSLQAKPGPRDIKGMKPK